MEWDWWWCPVCSACWQSYRTGPRENRRMMGEPLPSSSGPEIAEVLLSLADCPSAFLRDRLCGPVVCLDNGSAYVIPVMCSRLIDLLPFQCASLCLKSTGVPNGYHGCTKWVQRVYQMGIYHGCSQWAPQVYQMGTTGGTTWVRQMASASLVRQFRSSRVQSLTVGRQSLTRTSHILTLDDSSTIKHLPSPHTHHLSV